MDAIEYYALPYGVGDRLELQRFLTADHYDGMAKAVMWENTSEPQTQEEIFSSMIFTLRCKMTTSREEFEKWAVTAGFSITMNGEYYRIFVKTETRNAYEGWLAREAFSPSVKSIEQISDRQKLLAMMVQKELLDKYGLHTMDLAIKHCKEIIEACKNE